MDCTAITRSHERRRRERGGEGRTSMSMLPLVPILEVLQPRPIRCPPLIQRHLEHRESQQSSHLRFPVPPSWTLLIPQISPSLQTVVQGVRTMSASALETGPPRIPSSSWSSSAASSWPTRVTRRGGEGKWESECLMAGSAAMEGGGGSQKRSRGDGAVLMAVEMGRRRWRETKKPGLC